MKATAALEPQRLPLPQLLRGSFWISVLRTSMVVEEIPSLFYNDQGLNPLRWELMPKLQRCVIFLRRITWFILLKTRCDQGNAATGPQSFCLVTFTRVVKPINSKHMSKAYMHLLVNIVWTPNVELCPVNIAIRGRAVQRNYCLVLFSRRSTENAKMSSWDGIVLQCFDLSL